MIESQPPSGHPIPWALAGATVLGVAHDRMTRLGLDWTTLATLLASVGLVINSLVSAAKEFRAYLDRRAAMKAKPGHKGADR